jgi:hypothetical protein
LRRRGPCSIRHSAPKGKGKYRPTGRHNITNIVLKIEGNKATGRAYWFHYSNNNPERRAVLDGSRHYEDEMVKVNGKWLFRNASSIMRALRNGSDLTKIPAVNTR